MPYIKLVKTELISKQLHQMSTVLKKNTFQKTYLMFCKLLQVKLLKQLIFLHVEEGLQLSDHSPLSVYDIVCNLRKYTHALDFLYSDY